MRIASLLVFVLIASVPGASMGLGKECLEDSCSPSGPGAHPGQLPCDVANREVQAAAAAAHGCEYLTDANYQQCQPLIARTRAAADAYASCYVPAPTTSNSTLLVAPVNKSDPSAAHGTLIHLPAKGPDPRQAPVAAPAVDPHAADRAAYRANQEQIDAILHQLSDRARDAAQELGQLHYESTRAKKPAAKSHSLEDDDDDAPADDDPGRRDLYAAPTVADDGTCPDGTVAVTYSCRLGIPKNHAGCRTLDTRGSGAACLGANMCCLAPHETKVVLAASKSCLVRTCPSTSPDPAKAEKECPTTTNDVCALDESPWPSLAHCTLASPPALPTASMPATRWSAAACRPFAKALIEVAAAVRAQHTADWDARHAAEAAGDKLPCPHACGHAAQLEGYRNALVGFRQALNAMRLRGTVTPQCSQHLVQADIEAAMLAGNLATAAGGIRNWAPPEDAEGGPYQTFLPDVSRAGDLCAALAAYESCGGK